MKRLASVAFIVSYLAALNYGIFCHVLGYGTGVHPMMYFIVWDMFCGFTAYDARANVIAEGESGNFYELTPAPWGEFHPWGNLGRQHYDSLNNHTGPIGLNVLRHTHHEPITRVFVVEETWAKKYNIPDHVWQTRYDEPKQPQKYYRVRTVMLPDRTLVHNYGPWTQYQAIKMLEDNPRLRAQARQGRPLLLIEQEAPGREMYVNPPIGGDLLRSAGSPVGAPLGN